MMRQYPTKKMSTADRTALGMAKQKRKANAKKKEASDEERQPARTPGTDAPSTTEAQGTTGPVGGDGQNPTGEGNG